MKANTLKNHLLSNYQTIIYNKLPNILSVWQYYFLCYSSYKGDHVRWKHPDGRATTIPVYPEIGGWLLYEILAQLGATKEDLNRHHKKVYSTVGQLVN